MKEIREIIKSYGAAASEEIALSILAEIWAVLPERNGASLRSKKVTKHERNPLKTHQLY